MLRNQSKFYITDASFGIAQNIFTGAIIQTFLLESGVKEQNVALYVSAMSIISLCATLLTSAIADKVKNIIKYTAICNLCYTVFFVVLTFFSFSTDHSVNLKYISVFAAGTFIYIVGAFRQNIGFKLPFHILKDIDEYGPMLGTSGAITGLVGISFYGIMTVAMTGLKFFTVMRIFMPLGIVAILISFFASNSYKDIGNYTSTTADNQKKKLNIFKCKTFFVLFIPDFLHGFFIGTFSIMAVIGSFYKIIIPEMSGIMMLIVQSSYTITCFFYAKFSRRPQTMRYVFLFMCIGFAILLPTVLIGKSPFVFLPIYAILNFLFYFIGKHLQVVITKIVDYEILGQYSAFNSAVKTLGNLTSTAITIPLLQKIGGFTTLSMTSAAVVICATVYHIYTKNKKI